MTVKTKRGKTTSFTQVVITLITTRGKTHKLYSGSDNSKNKER